MSSSSSTSPKRLTDFKVLIFDVFGTLIDSDSGIYVSLQPLLSAASSDIKSWTRRDALLAFQSVVKNIQVQEPTMPFKDLMAASHAEFAKRLGVSEFGAAQSTSGGDVEGGAGPSGSADGAGAAGKQLDPHRLFAESISTWTPFPDSTSSLSYLLNDQNYKLCVLSNVDRPTFSHAHKSLGYPFTLILTAQEAGAAKPSSNAYKQVLEEIKTKLGVDREDCVVVAQSLEFDLGPAGEAGLMGVWIDRKGAVLGSLGNETTGTSAGGKKVGDESKLWTWRFQSLEEMVEAVKKEVGEKTKQRV